MREPNILRLIVISFNRRSSQGTLLQVLSTLVTNWVISSQSLLGGLELVLFVARWEYMTYMLQRGGELRINRIIM